MAEAARPSDKAVAEVWYKSTNDPREMLQFCEQAKAASQEVVQTPMCAVAMRTFQAQGYKIDKIRPNPENPSETIVAMKVDDLIKIFRANLGLPAIETIAKSSIVFELVIQK